MNWKGFKMVLLFFLIGLKLIAQEEDLLKVATIPSELLEKSNAVVRLDDNRIEINAYNDVVLTTHRIITVINEKGNAKLGTTVGYDNNVQIKKMEAKIFDAFGKETKKYKVKDFKDVSAVDGGALYSDSRVKYLDFTPTSYPYTLMFDLEIKYSSTAFIPGWRPIEGYYASTQNASYKIENNTDIGVKVKTINFDTYNITKESENYYTAKNLKSLQPESYSPEFKSYAPYLKTTLTEFDMEGVKGENNNWQDFGRWMSDNLLTGIQAIPESVKLEVKSLTEGVEDPMERAKIVYQYMQGKTRYISVQVGIGGWKPMLADDVNRLGYGDCKGLSNYTKVLLKEVGVEAYYTIIYGADDLVDIDKDFSTTEGNHAILAIPHDGDYIWLECTSQTNPFGFISGWTDDRDALVITPEGGKIIHTKVYDKEESFQETKATIFLSKDSNISGEVEISTGGYQYRLHEWIQRKPIDDQKLHYKSNYWDYVNNIEITNITIENNKDEVIFNEAISLSAVNYAASIGDKILFQPNMFNRVTSVPNRYRNRKIDFEIQRGFIDKDEFTITLDNSLQVETLPEPVSIENKFGSYSFSITSKDPSIIVYKRTYTLNKGYYPKEDYEEYRDFVKEVSKNDSAKIILINNP